MKSFLSTQDQLQLRHHLQNTSDADVCRRSQALLKLDQGNSVTTVAQEFGVTRQTLYNWKQRWELMGTTSLANQPRCGRPSLWTEQRVKTLRQLLADSPQDHGFPHLGWTTGLLKQRMEQLKAGNVSESSLRDKLHELNYAWKRFRSVLKPDPAREKKKTHPQTCQ